MDRVTVNRDPGTVALAWAKVNVQRTWRLGPAYTPTVYSHYGRYRALVCAAYNLPCVLFRFVWIWTDLLPFADPVCCIRYAQRNDGGYF